MLRVLGLLKSRFWLWGLGLYRVFGEFKGYRAPTLNSCKKVTVVQYFLNQQYDLPAPGGGLPEY